MTRIDHRHLLACSAAVAALFGVGCGGSNNEDKGPGVPAATVRQLDQRLDEIQRRYDSATQDDNQGACDDIATDSFPAITSLIRRLPSDTDQSVKDAVNESFANLQQLTDDGCKDVSTKTDTDTTPTETTPPQTDTQPPETDTQPPETDTQTTPDTTPTTPGDTGGAGPGNNGNGNGNGNGGGTNGGGSNKGGAVPPGQ